MNPFDAAALFWWVRNAHFFELGLQDCESVRTCRYEELVARPERVVAGLYRLLDRPFPDRVCHRHLPDRRRIFDEPRSCGPLGGNH